MLTSNPALRVNQKSHALGIPNRFSHNAIESSGHKRREPPPRSAGAESPSPQGGGSQSVSINLQSSLEAIADPAHPEHRELLRWYGRPYDPEYMGEIAAKRRIGVIARRRLAAKAAAAKRKSTAAGTG